MSDAYLINLVMSMLFIWMFFSRGAQTVSRWHRLVQNAGTGISQWAVASRLPLASELLPGIPVCHIFILDVIISSFSTRMRAGRAGEDRGIETLRQPRDEEPIMDAMTACRRLCPSRTLAAPSGSPSHFPLFAGVSRCHTRMRCSRGSTLGHGVRSAGGYDGTATRL